MILTSITTVVGLTPTAYGIGGSDPFVKPMALAIGWGLFFATALTLIIVPCVYTILDDLKLKSKDWAGRLKTFVRERKGWTAHPFISKLLSDD